MAQLKFYKSASAPAAAATGAVWFDTTHHTIQVKTATGWDKYAGALINDATWDGLNLTITKHDGSSIVLNFSDFASASGVTAALAGKLAIGTADDVAGAQSYHGLKKDIAAAQAAAIAAAKVKDVDTTATNGVNLLVDANGKLDVTVAPGSIAANDAAVVTGGAVYTAIANKNVSAEGDTLVSASASGNKVTVTATDALTTAVANANSALQDVTVATGDNNGEIKVQGHTVAVQGLGSAAYTAANAYATAAQGTAADNATANLTILMGDGDDSINKKIASAIDDVKGTLDNTDAKTLQAINDELDAVDGEISNIKSSIAGGVHFRGVIAATDGETLADNLPDPSNYNIGDIIMLVWDSDGAHQEPSKEYILTGSGDASGNMWFELGDLSPADERLTAIEESYVKSVATTDGTYVKLTPDTAANNAVVVAVDDSAIQAKFEAIDAYTVNGQAISTNPVLDGADILITGYAKGTAAELAATDTINAALGKLEARVDAAAAGGVQSVGGEAGSITLRGGQPAAGSVNLAMSGKEIQATLVGFDTKEDAGTAAGLIAELDAEIAGTGTNGVKVTVTEVDGKITAVAVDDAAVATKAYADSLLEWALFE